MTKLFFILFSFSGLSQISLAQKATFISSGMVTYQRKINIPQAMEMIIRNREGMTKERLTEITTRNRNTGPLFDTANFQLAFTDVNSLYTPENEGLKSSENFNIPWAYNNTIQSNFKQGKTTAIKILEDKIYQIEEERRPIINWKITTEQRTIQGYLCRRANALVNDSIYVVAFYTDQILVKYGPESFAGLPGLILSVYLPSEHISWQATKIEISPLKKTESPLSATYKPETVTGAIFRQKLNEILTKYGLQRSGWLKNFNAY